MRPVRMAGLVVTILATYAAWLALEARSSAAEDGEVGSVDVAEICARVREGRPPVFVDVREPEEYAEEHLPGAVAMPIREMDARARAELGSAELVVPYCLKDFRGFEGARRLTELGFEDVRVMRQLGINGWRSVGLPTAGETPGRSDAEARELLAGICRNQDR